MEDFEKNIKYSFKSKELLQLALTHSSFANESKDIVKYNERLEFLGDAVLQLITSEKLYNENPTMPEGKMSKQRAALVCEDALALYSKDIDLGDFIRLGKGEETTGGRNRPSIL
ncbi:MAG: ribonuclease III domain-containing protein, partial [Oscillospiraceae bacterium]